MQKFSDNKLGLNQAFNSLHVLKGLQQVPFFQPRLTINPSNDIYEQEADAMADKVMGVSRNGNKQQPFFMPAISSIQRKCEHCEEEGKKMQRKEINNQEATADTNFENYVESLDGSGQSLPGEVRNFYEPRFGFDFSNVKVHTDNTANQSAKNIDSLAYTHGNNIVFAAGQYDPGNDNGKHLIAHELTHVVQQNSVSNNKVQKQGPDDELHLPPVPHFQLTEPTFQVPHGVPGLPGRRTRTHPYFQFIPPVNLTLTPQQLSRVIGDFRPGYLQPSPPATPEPSNDGVRLGGDLFRDIITGNNQVSAVARGVDAAHFRLFHRVVDLFHEPTLTFSAGTPGGGTENSTQLGLGILNWHLSRNVEFAALQLGVDTDAGVTFGSQLEIHTPDPHWSYFINFGYSLQRDPNRSGNYQFSSTGISLSFYPHFLNP